MVCEIANLLPRKMCIWHGRVGRHEPARQNFHDQFGRLAVLGTLDTSACVFPLDQERRPGLIRLHAKFRLPGG